MVFCFFLFFVGFYVFYFSSFHSLIVLLFVEVLILGVLCFLFFMGYSWFFCLMFLLVAVCLGAYGVSLFVSLTRSKGVNYFLSF
uniref:NADH dehydrogenase subunit 4L n=2 Tax=Rhizoglyphinae TaxID=474068 RepID=A0A344AR63_9ACAR|nr:NADH dehydrogenase subunit 4L [Sancassania berlesei]YP_009498340.1 NADH dehydrogenase subunit 4L [Rhizoglyphus robini]AGZ63936.1 NADH dehydrogenase subunit 4L [Sancassania berlesei]AWX53539.1 NADH dehydrogenase subunit 4L [Rhizoglyphus robini]